MERIVDSRDRLGECPLWDGTALWWIDIHGKAIKRFDGKLTVHEVPEMVGSIAFREAGGLIAAMQTGIFEFPSGKLMVKNPFTALTANWLRSEEESRFRTARRGVPTDA